MKKKLSNISFFLMMMSVFCLDANAGILKKETIYIAVAGPMQAEEGGKDMLRGIRLCLQHLKKENKITHQNIELLIFDDQNNEQMAIRKASEIAADDRIVLVLGHYYSSTSIAAGEIYRKNGIPAITATASADSVTEGNEWYFRVIPPNGYEGAFIANYLKSLNKDSVSMIYIQNSYGISLADNFEKTAKGIGLSVKRKWAIDLKSKKLSEDFEKIGAELRSEKSPGMIFFATYEVEGMKIIASFNYPGTGYSIVGADAFSSTSFPEAFKIYPQERIKPGYYSDGIYTVSPFMMAIGNEKAQEFRDEFVKTYGYEPSWEPACYYDAMRTAAEAIERAEIDPKAHVRENRKRIRDALSEFSSPDVSVKGITGDIYFNGNRNFNRPMAIGIYQRQKLLPAFVQYQPIMTSRPDIFKDITGKTIVIDDQVMTQAHVVYAGIDINEISYINREKAVCTVDFYLWFRFQKEFDIRSIIFTNAPKPVELGKPILEETDNDITTRTYHIKADFKIEADMQTYPFDHRIVSVKFCHSDRIRNNLIFIPDALGLPQMGTDHQVPGRQLNVPGWRIKDSNCYQQIIRRDLPGGHQAEYSQFVASVRAERKGAGFAVKVFSPIFLIFILLYVIYTIPADQIIARILICITGIIAGGIVQVSVLYKVGLSPSALAIGYFFFAVYGLSAIGGIIASGTYMLHRRNLVNHIRLINRAGKIIHLSGLILAGIFVAILYQGLYRGL